MAKKLTDNFGNTPKVAVSISEAQKKQFALENWFVEYKNTDTRNAIAQGLELVDHGGDTIFYSGEKNGFKVSFDQVLFLVNSRHSGVFKFIVYHKKPTEKNWKVWQMNKKAPKQIIALHVQGGKLATRI